MRFPSARSGVVFPALLFAVLAATALATAPAVPPHEPGAGKPGGDGKEGGGEAGGEKREANRLIHEKSPYLLQHAYNPVDWYPWGEEAFAKAKKEDKPVFLSIGYSTCHWCHVMERESFESEEVAEYLNEHFVSIKVDREERPDIDAIYMEFVQATNNGRGGWPLSAWLHTDGRPFLGGTYFPPDRFLELSRRIIQVWKEDREVLEERSREIADYLRQRAAAVEPGESLDTGHSAAAFRHYDRAHDETFGGFGPAPKFPRPASLDFLMRYARRTGEERAIRMVRNTLDHMIRGGIHDHLAGGFHRYSTDRFWLVPHFEKMLYDNALIPRTLLDANRLTGDRRYVEVARRTLDYLLRRMRGPEGAFYSAEDADTEGEEGKTYVWLREEILRILGKERGSVFCDFYGVTPEGNFRDPHKTGEQPPLCVLHVTMEGGEEALAEKLGRPVAEVRKQLAEDRARLLEARNRRPQPFLDDKVLAEWNGLAVSAFARAFQVTGEGRYLEAAKTAAAFVLDRMVADGKLRRRYRGGEVAIDGFLEDYASFVEGLLDLYEADLDRRWLEEAVRFGKDTVRFFWDDDKGGFFSTAPHHEKLVRRVKEFYDGVIPSGNSIAFLNMLRLQEMTSDEFFEPYVSRFRKIGAGLLSSSPQRFPYLLCGAEFTFQKPLQVVVIGPPSDARTRAMLAEVRRRFLPSKVLVYAADETAAQAMASLVPLMESKRAIGGKPTTFVCRDRVCKLPAGDLETLREQLSAARE